MMSKGGGPCRGAVIRPGTRERGILFLEGKKGIRWNGEYVASRIVEKEKISGVRGLRVTQEDGEMARNLPTRVPPPPPTSTPTKI